MGRQRIGQTVSYGLSRPEAYIIVVAVFVAVVVALVGGWPGWVVLVSLAAGVVLLGLLILDSLANPDVEGEVLIADIDVGEVRDPALRAKVSRALEYVRAARRLSQRDTSGVLDVANDELPQLEQAARSIYQMSRRLQEFRADRLVQRDLSDLQQRSQRGQLTEDQKAQLDTLRRIDELARSAEQEIDSALAHLGRSYAEMQTIKATPEFRGRVVDAFDELGASAKRLSELADGYDEVYSSRTQPGKS